MHDAQFIYNKYLVLEEELKIIVRVDSVFIYQLELCFGILNCLNTFTICSVSGSVSAWGRKIMIITILYVNHHCVAYAML